MWGKNVLISNKIQNKSVELKKITKNYGFNKK